jgi:hypothetical protein
MITMVLMYQVSCRLINFSHTLIHGLALPLGIAKNDRRDIAVVCVRFSEENRVSNLPSVVRYRPRRIQRRHLLSGLVAAVIRACRWALLQRPMC